MRGRRFVLCGSITVSGSCHESSLQHVSCPAGLFGLAATHPADAVAATPASQLLKRRKTSVPLVPPKPNELDNAAWIFISRAWCGT